MTSTKTTSRAGGTSILGLLGIAFVVLKLTGVIAWSWWWVLAPFWIPLAVGIVVLAVLGILIAVSNRR